MEAGALRRLPPTSAQKPSDPLPLLKSSLHSRRMGPPWDPCLKPRALVRAVLA